MTYKNVKEVVALNQKLLLIVRSERSQHTQQLDESKEAEKATAQRQMEQIAAELGNMKERREQQQRMIQEIARQRDMYRELHNENARRTTYEQRSGDGAGGAAVDPSDSTASSSAAGAVPQSPQRGRGAQASAVAAAESALLAKTNADFAAYRAEREEADKLAIAQQSAERDAKVCFYVPLHFKRILLTILTSPPHILTFKNEARCGAASCESRGWAALRDAARRAPRGGEWAARDAHRRGASERRKVPWRVVQRGARAERCGGRARKGARACRRCRRQVRMLGAGEDDAGQVCGAPR